MGIKGTEEDAGQGNKLRYEMQRRMRIYTVAPRVAKTHEVLFSHAQVRYPFLSVCAA